MDIQQISTDAVKPYDRNPRNNAAAVGMVAASIHEFGFQQPIVVDNENVIIVGHTRHAAAERLGLETIPVLVAKGLTEEQVKAYRIADNRTGEEATWDQEVLLGEINDLLADEFDISLLGFSDDEIAAIKAEGVASKGKTDPDDIPPTEEIAISAPGDTWILGRHRVHCGDSTDPNALRQALENPADMVWIDPPYNVDYTGGPNGERKAIANDDMDEAGFRIFLAKTMTAHLANAKPGGCIYVAHSEKFGSAFADSMKEAGWLHKQTLIWVKNSAVLGRQDYNWRHEPILYGWKPGAGHYFSGDYSQNTVIDDATDPSKLSKADLLELCAELQRAVQDTVHRESRPSRSELHPTMKPVALVERHIEASSRPGQTILDGFGGSGTTLIAAEKSARVAALVEMEPLYVDVIIRRWQAFTGHQATLDGVPFDEAEKGKAA